MARGSQNGDAPPSVLLTLTDRMAAASQLLAASERRHFDPD